LATRAKRKSDVLRDTAVKASRQPADVRQVSDIVSLVGRKVSSLRRAKGLSLQQLAAVSDVSPAAIHKIERSGMVPTITTLLKLAAALGVSVSYFVQEDDSPPEPVHFTPADHRHGVYTPHKRLSLAGITGSYRQFQAAAAVARMDPGANSGEKLLNHSGEELVHIIAGEAVFRVNGQEYNLKAGDSLQFNGNVPHQWENRSKKPVDLIWVVVRNG
jgi:transcriptional regulator with XRE-family HTH domain